MIVLVGLLFLLLLFVAYCSIGVAAYFGRPRGTAPPWMQRLVRHWRDEPPNTTGMIAGVVIPVGLQIPCAL